jgi:cysteine-rich repeat protein
MKNPLEIYRCLLTSVLFTLALFPAHGAHAQCDMLPGCELVWADEFDGSSVNPARWEFQTGDGSQYGIPGWGNNELQWYQTDNATVANGMLTIRARQESAGGRAYTSARLRSRGRGDFLYGRFEMRARLPVGQGLWPAFWMLATDPSTYGVWAASGEIDIMESIGGNQVYGTIHYGDTAPGGVYSGASTIVAGATSGFHVYAVEWEPTEIRWYVDGQLYSTKTSWFSTGGPYPAPFDVDFHLLLNLAVGGNFPGNPGGSTVFPQDYVIDYVRVYQQPPPDPDKAATCQATKVRTAGKYAKCVATASAKAIKRSAAVETFRLIQCSTKLSDLFVKAETKATGSCPSEDDSPAVGGDLDSCVGDAVTALGGVPGPGGAEARCQARKVREAGKYARCRFNATFAAITKGLPPDYTGCEGKLASTWSRLEGSAANPCLTSGDLTALRAGLDACHAAVAARLAGPGCGNGLVDLREECDDGNTVNGDGCTDQCELEAEYQQNFEALVQASPSALADDRWRVFGNVFHGVTGNYLYGYGPFAAPNGNGAFCDINTGQGAPAQGNQQLVVYSDYNNGDHANGHVIEANVFRERTILVGDVGKTLTVRFDAKRGNLAGSSTARAFIKTLDPNAAFATTNFVSTDTTAIPSTWGTYSVALDIHAGLVGQLLQYGFSNTATHYQGSGIFYDNVVAQVVPTP